MQRILIYISVLLLLAIFSPFGFADPVNLTPLEALNPLNTEHTVFLELVGIGGFCTDDDQFFCYDDNDCDDEDLGTCDFSDHTVGFVIQSGPNSDEPDYWTVTDSDGKAAFTYTGDGGPGTDTIQACWDVDAYSPGVHDENNGVQDCIDDGNGFENGLDIPSNIVTKTWTYTVDLTPIDAFNPINTTHVLTARSPDIPKRCAASEGFGYCSDDSDCSNVVGSCSRAGYPVFFAVVGGPNSFMELPIGVTNKYGVATSSYSSTVEGVDTLQACLDGDPLDFGIHDEFDGFSDCVADAYYEPDVPSNLATKAWFANFVTGGAGVATVNNGKKTLQFSGIVGKAGSPGIRGQWNAVSKVGTKTISCHFSTFTSLAFSGPAATNPASTHNTATFTTGVGKCNDGKDRSLTATIVDYGEGKKVPRDTANVSGDADFSTGGTKNLASGNLQVHSINP